MRCYLFKSTLKIFLMIPIYPCRHSRSPLQGRPWSWETDRAVSVVPWIAASKSEPGQNSETIPSLESDSKSSFTGCVSRWLVWAFLDVGALSAVVQLLLRLWLTGEAEPRIGAVNPQQSGKHCTSQSTWSWTKRNSTIFTPSSHSDLLLI